VSCCGCFWARFTSSESRALASWIGQLCINHPQL
jgi:hypothetical protein